MLRAGKSEADARAFVGELFRRVPILDQSPRNSAMTFARQANKGDVHLTWENEALLEQQETPGKFEIVYPASGSIRAEPFVCLVDELVDRRGTRPAAEAYLKYLHTPAAQRVIAENGYRPTDPDVANEFADRFPAMPVFSLRDCGVMDWDEAQKKFFADGGVFDQVFSR